jgi:hypothetical protein
MVSCVLFPFQGTAVFIVLANRAEFVLNCCGKADIFFWVGFVVFYGGFCEKRVFDRRFLVV